MVSRCPGLIWGDPLLLLGLVPEPPWVTPLPSSLGPPLPALLPPLPLFPTWGFIVVAVRPQLLGPPAMLLGLVPISGLIMARLPAGHQMPGWGPLRPAPILLSCPNIIWVEVGTGLILGFQGPAWWLSQTPIGKGPRALPLGVPVHSRILNLPNR